MSTIGSTLRASRQINGGAALPALRSWVSVWGTDCGVELRECGIARAARILPQLPLGARQQREPQLVVREYFSKGVEITRLGHWLLVRRQTRPAEAKVAPKRAYYRCAGAARAACS